MATDSPTAWLISHRRKCFRNLLYYIWNIKGSPQTSHRVSLALNLEADYVRIRSSNQVLPGSVCALLGVMLSSAWIELGNCCVSHLSQPGVSKPTILRCDTTSWVQKYPHGSWSGLMVYFEKHRRVIFIPAAMADSFAPVLSCLLMQLTFANWM